VAAALGAAELAVLFLAVLIALPAILLIFAVREPAIPHTPVRLRAVLRLVASRAGLAGLLIALLGGAGFEFFGVTAGPRLVDLGWVESNLALFFGLLAPAGLAIGAIIGGAITDRTGPVRATAGSLALLSAILLWIGLGDLGGGANSSNLGWFAAVYFAIGTLTASSYALFMSLSRGDFAATRFSLFMAMTNACEAWSGFAGGAFADSSYGLSLLSLTAIGGLAGFPLYWLWRRQPSRGSQ
jgi:hypothetical protein